MNRNPPSGIPPSGSPLPAKPVGQISPGVQTLLKGAPSVRSAQGDPGFNSRKERASLPFWYFVAGDLVMLQAILLVVLALPKPLSPFHMGLCVVATLVGAALALYPFLAAELSRVPPVADVVLPQWTLTRDAEPGGASRWFIVHLHAPVFVAEINHPETRPAAVPVWFESTADLDLAARERLLREATDYAKWTLLRRSHSSDISLEPSKIPGSQRTAS